MVTHPHDHHHSDGLLMHEPIGVHVDHISVLDEIEWVAVGLILLVVCLNNVTQSQGAIFGIHGCHHSLQIGFESILHWLRHFLSFRVVFGESILRDGLRRAIS